MTTFKIVPLDSDASYRIAELHGIVGDLALAGALCQRFMDVAAPLDPLASHGVGVAAVIRYARCFKGGVRPTLPPTIIEGLPPELKAFHSFIIDLRDKFIAHSVNPFELNRTTVQVPEDPPPGWEPEGLGFQQTSVMLPSAGMLRNLMNLAGEVKKGLEAYIELAKPVVLAEARKIPPLELAKREILQLCPPDWNAVRRTRPRGSKPKKAVD